MNVLITGGTGFLGRYLIRSAQKLGCHVSVLLRSPCDLSGVRVYRADLVSPHSEVKEAFRNQDLILHAAVDYRSSERTVAMTESVLKFASSSGNPKIVLVSSQNASFKNPRGYSLSKRQCEELLKASYSRWCIVRPTLIYDDDGGFIISGLVRAARTFHLVPIPGAGTASIQPVHAEDVAEVVARSARIPDGTTLTVAGGEAVTLRELAEHIQKHFPSTFIFSVPTGLLRLAGTLSPVLHDKVRELEQLKTLTPEEERELSSVLPGPRRGILEDLPKLIGLAT
ncbi:NAD(P)H-binding protein [Candidatus Uhrbacteria bacterium]|nr:NAD(P)H-binding protein [Candidatus Uhrbacteria bacterium]